MAAVHGPRLEIACCYGTKAKYCAFSNMDAGSDACTGADPSVALDVHAVCDEGKCRVVIIVSCAADVTILRKNDMRVELHGGWIVDFDAIAGGDVVGTD
jgi:hypothetical protein